MENNELKNPVLNELEDDVLDNVSGGADKCVTCLYCGKSVPSSDTCSACGRLLVIIQPMP